MLEIEKPRKLDKTQVPQTGQGIKYEAGLGTSNWTELKRVLGTVEWTALMNVFKMDSTGGKDS